MIKFLISNKTKIGNALAKFDMLGGQCLYVVKKNRLLIGSLTDGDWRRASLKNENKNNTVENICNKNPVKINIHTPYSTIKKLFVLHSLDSIPLVNEKNIILKIISKNQIFKRRKNIPKKSSIPIIIMAGGKGTRLSPFTEVLPKPLIPINGKTIISRIIEKFTSKGFTKFYISINEKSKIIKSYFVEKNLKKKISFIEEKKPLGTVGALTKLQKVNSKFFFVTNCDTFINYDFNKVSKFHIQNKNSLTMMVVKKKYSIPYGVCDKNNKNELLQITEKPELKYLINIGSYILNKDIIKLLKKNKHCDFNEFINILQKNNKKIGLYQISKKRWQDVGTWSEYKKAVSLMM
jgi:dTDP-glucose pyrophosphorylase